jgi:hypothetical protein
LKPNSAAPALPVAASHSDHCLFDDDLSGKYFLETKLLEQHAAHSIHQMLSTHEARLVCQLRQQQLTHARLPKS